jgi:c-di-GMP-binding flagellar brake protein YcgR
MSPEDQINNLPSPEEKDMRYFPRWEVNNRVSYYLEGENTPHQGRTKDISCAGACIAGIHEILPHQKIKVTVELANHVKIDLKAHVLWVKTEDNKPVMGITFYDTPDTTQDLILKHAFELNRERFVRQLYKGWENTGSLA